jgi:hypothetical protein
MKMNAKTMGIVFLFVCLLIVLFIGQWVYLGNYTQPLYLGSMEPVREGYEDLDGVKPVLEGYDDLEETVREGYDEKEEEDN